MEDLHLFFCGLCSGDKVGGEVVHSFMYGTCLNVKVNRYIREAPILLSYMPILATNSDSVLPLRQ